MALSGQKIEHCFGTFIHGTMAASCLPRALECPDEPLCDDMSAIENRMCFDNKSISLPFVAEYSDRIINSEGIGFIG